MAKRFLLLFMSVHISKGGEKFSERLIENMLNESEWM